MIFQDFSPKQRQAMLWWAMPENNGNEHWMEYAEL